VLPLRYKQKTFDFLAYVTHGYGRVTHGLPKKFRQFGAAVVIYKRRILLYYKDYKKKNSIIIAS